MSLPSIAEPAGELITTDNRRERKALSHYMRKSERVVLNLPQRLFLRHFCHPPPGREAEGSAVEPGSSGDDSLALLRTKFGASFLEAIRDRSVIDVGCGEGHQVVGCAANGARFTVGAECRPIFDAARTLAEELGLQEKVAFTLDPLERQEKESFDVAFSQDAFEHYHEPEKVMSAVFGLLKPGGRFFITFGPPWHHPLGVHMFYMIKYPWVRLLFSEKTIMTVRRLYRDDNAERYTEVEGGLNKMTVRKFCAMVRDSGFHRETLTLKPIKGLPLVNRIPLVNEFFTASVSAVLRKP